MDEAGFDVFPVIRLNEIEDDIVQNNKSAVSGDEIERAYDYQDGANKIIIVLLS